MSSFAEVLQRGERAKRNAVLDGCLTNMLVVMIVLVAVGFFLYWRAEQRAAAFERVTGQHVSTWDTLFLELRVEGPTHKDG